MISYDQLSIEKIPNFEFSKDKLNIIKEYQYGSDWPVVYLLEDGKKIYIGQTKNVYKRSNEHITTAEKKRFKRIHVITDEEFNISATLDIESLLLQYMSADGRFILTNKNKGIANHSYFDREKYKAKFNTIWKRLKYLELANQDLDHIRNSDLFKYSPYKALTSDQLSTVASIFDSIVSGKKGTSIVSGKPGTGKTIVATYLVKQLTESDETKKLKVGLVIPVTSLRTTLKAVFKNIAGLKPGMVIGPSDVVKNQYDVLIVDESHRLKQRRALSGYGAFDKTNAHLKLDKATGTELDWILKSSTHQVLFYDENQSVRPADIPPERFKSIDAMHHKLSSQLRVEAGTRFIEYINSIFDHDEGLEHIKSFDDYEFKTYEDIGKLKNYIEKKDKQIGLCRLVAGFAWDWNSNPKKEDNAASHDIEIDNVRLKWNHVTKDWVNSKNAVHEVGCIHTVQGYDLNHVGVIIGPELAYEPGIGFVVNRDNYKDKKGKVGTTDEELKLYIINIYKTLLTRGIKGTHVYIYDNNLRNYFKKFVTTETY